MTTIFLGQPPAGIKKWIEDHTVPVAPKGKVLYRMTAGGEWLQDDADISNGAFNGFANKENAVEVIIPSKDASGNDVTSIVEEAFAGCSGLTSVMIPDSVTSIGNSAFAGCSGLTSVAIIANGGDAEAVKQAMINAGVNEDIEWIMHSVVID